MKVFVCVCVWVWSCLALAGTTTAQISGTETESYALRVENTSFGRIEMSADAGKTFVLVGRVVRSATSATPLRAVKDAGKVSHASQNGLAFGVAPGQILKLRPQWIAKPAPGNKPSQKNIRPPASEPSVIQTDIPMGQGIFGSLLPPSGTGVQILSSAGEPGPIPPHFTPSESDVFHFQVTLPKKTQTGAEGSLTLVQRIEALSKAYAEGAAARAKAAKRKVVSGTLTLQAKLPEGEPDPIDAVTYMADGDLVAAQNTPPYSYAWDTRKVADGEHIVEIRAFNKAGRMLTRVRALVVVQNTLPAP